RERPTNKYWCASYARRRPTLAGRDRCSRRVRGGLRDRRLRRGGSQSTRCEFLLRTCLALHPKSFVSTVLRRAARRGSNGRECVWDRETYLFSPAPLPH